MGKRLPPATPLRNPTNWLGGVILSTALVEGVLWTRHRVNAALELGKTKVSNEMEMTVQYRRQADYLLRLAVVAEQMRRPGAPIAHDASY